MACPTDWVFWGQTLPQQILRHLYGIDDYAIGPHEAKRARNSDILGRAHSLVVDPPDFNVYAITNPPIEIVPHCFVK